MKEIFFFAIAVVSFASCKKSTNGSVNSSGTLLSKYIVLDATVPSNDTLNVLQFRYDNSNRISEFVSVDYDLFPILDTVKKRVYYYNGSDVKPYKIVLYENSLDSADLVSYPTGSYETGIINGVSTIYYFYSSGKLIKDSTSGNNYTQTNNYNYINNLVIRNQSSTTDGISAPAYIDTFYQSSQNGNLINQIDTLYRASISNIYEGYAYQIDDHPNPLGSAIFTPFSIIEADGLYANPEQQNNYTSIDSYSNTADGNNSSSTKVSFTYTYNSNGYPVSALLYNRNDNTGGVTVAEKIIYVYTK